MKSRLANHIVFYVDRTLFMSFVDRDCACSTIAGEVVADKGDAYAYDIVFDA